MPKNVFSRIFSDGQSMKKVRLPGLNPGIRISISVASSVADGEERLLFTKFEGYSDGGMMIVGAPLFRGFEYPMSPGTQCTVSYMDGSNIYYVDCEVRDTTRESGLRFLLLACISDVQKIERRDDFRLSVLFPCEIIRCKERKEGREDTVYKATMGDISGGGARILIPHVLEVGEEVLCHVTLAGDEDKQFSAIVRWVAPIAFDRTDMYKTGLQFVFPTETEKDAIVRYIFQQQVSQRKKLVDKD